MALAKRGKMRYGTRLADLRVVMSSKVIVLITAVGCVVAAGAGSYLAVRESARTSAAQAAPESETPGVAPSSAAPVTSLAPVTRKEPRSLKTKQPPPTRAPRTGNPAVVLKPQVAAPTRLTEPAAPEAPAVDAPTPDRSTAEAEIVAAPTPAASAAPIDIFDVVEVPADAVLGIRIDTPLSTETSEVEDRVVGRLTRNVSVDGRVVIYAGAEVHGTVTLLERGGRARERARLGVRFTSLVIDGTRRIPIDTEPIFREGDAKTGQTTARLGTSAVIGGIIGGILGGKRGAAIGGAAGAAGGAAVVMAGDRSEVTVPAGTNLTVRLAAAVSVTVER